jgi:hypothetical protein
MASTGARQRARREAFLSELATGRSVGGSAAAAGLSRATVYRWRERLAGFARRWDAAVDAGVDTLEAEASRRAVDDTARPASRKGRQAGDVADYSDRLLMFLLQARRPQVYRPARAQRPRA